MDAPLPTRLGDYRILGLLGEGAMGRVYLAAQDQPRREVALKVLRASSSAELAQRFRREAELLAGLDHPGIARIHAAGTFDVEPAPLPYLAMERVQGETLRDWLRGDPPWSRRLQLLIDVCRAVHHAHTRGVVHRDLKPENLAVDAEGQVKVLDFGVAHVMREDVTRMTVAGEVLGTLPYLAPELLGAEASRVDPRADVYALGVIAYEMLAGGLPLPGLAGATLASGVRLLLTEIPPRLARRAPAARGDLDTIVMKAMDADARRRYASAAELAADLERYLAHQPIAARPPSAGYVLHLFVRRHRVLSAAVVLVALAMVAATVVSLRFALAAEQRLAEREVVTRFLVDMFAAADPERALGAELTVREVLDVAREDLLRDTDLPPGARAQLLRSLGQTYTALGLSEPALALLERAQRETLAGAPLERARIELARIQALHLAGAHEVAAAAAEDLAATVWTDPALQVAVRIEWGSVLDSLERFDEAEAVLNEAAAGAAGLDPVWREAIDKQRASVLQRDGRYAESLALLSPVAMAATQRWGREHPRSQQAWGIVAHNLRELGRYDEAEAVYRENLEIRRRVLGASHPQTLISLSGLASLLAQAGRPDEGLPLAREAYERAQAVHGPDAPQMDIFISLRAYVAEKAGALAEAAALYRENVDRHRRQPDGPGAMSLADYNNLANVLRLQGEVVAAADVFEELLPLAERVTGREHLYYALFSANYGETLRVLGRREAAEAQLRFALERLRELLGEDHPRTTLVVQRLARLEAGDILPD